MELRMNILFPTLDFNWHVCQNAVTILKARTSLKFNIIFKKKSTFLVKVDIHFQVGERPAENALQKLNTEIFSKLALMFRKAHALAFNNMPFSDFSWMCKLDQKKV